MKKEELLSYFTQLVPDGNWKRIGSGKKQSSSYHGRK